MNWWIWQCICCYLIWCMRCCCCFEYFCVCFIFLWWRQISRNDWYIILLLLIIISQHNWSHRLRVGIWTTISWTARYRVKSDGWLRWNGCKWWIDEFDSAFVGFLIDVCVAVVVLIVFASALCYVMVTTNILCNDCDVILLLLISCYAMTELIGWV